MFLFRDQCLYSAFIHLFVPNFWYFIHSYIPLGGCEEHGF
uniref:Uncharacterized protein n=1 Tax=Arundo donax TaxID=35708 RepID=A0A0A9FXL4_ARUDO